MKKDRYLFFKLLILISLFLNIFSNVYGAGTPIIPKFQKKSVPNIGFNNEISLNILNEPEKNTQQPFVFNNFKKVVNYQRGNWAYLPKNNFNKNADFGFSMEKTKLLQEQKNYEIPSIYVRTAARYFDVSSSSGANAVSGGLVAGLYITFDRYRDTGIIDLGAASRTTALMAGSSYFGLMAGRYAVNNAMNPVFVSFGNGFVNAAGNAAGGTLAGTVYALGAYASGSIDRHTARLMVAKSAVGSSAAAGITAITGTSTITTGIFAIGTFTIPYLTALGTSFIVEKFFEAADKQEEKDRIGLLLEEIY